MTYTTPTLTCNGDVVSRTLGGKSSGAELGSSNQFTPPVSVGFHL
jgi:hypothetical protein